MRISRSKKIKIGILILSLIIISVIGFWSMKTTASNEVSYKIKIKELREDSDLGYGELRENGKGIDRCIKIWNLVKVADNCEDGSDCEELPLYCLQAELGFTNNSSTENAGDSDSHTVEYTHRFDMKLRSDKKSLNDGTYDNEKKKSESQNNELIITQQKNDSKYNKVVWLADNMYIPGKDTAQDKIALLRKAGVIKEDEVKDYTIELKKEILTKLKTQEQQHHIIDVTEEINNLSNDQIDELFFSECFISDDIMEVVQQLAFWYIIHEDDSSKEQNYHHENLPDLYCTEEESKGGSVGDDSYKSLKQVYKSTIACKCGNSQILFKIGTRYQDYAEKYYEWLIGEAKKQQGTTYYESVAYENSPYDNEGKSKVAVKLKNDEQDQKNIKVEESGNNYIIGPYELVREFGGPFSIEKEEFPQNCTILKDKTEQENRKRKRDC